MAARKPLMVGNWKMFKTGQETVTFLEQLSALIAQGNLADVPDAAVCPPYTALYAAAYIQSQLPKHIGLGAQNMDSHEEGAYTGEVSPRMLKELSVEYVIIGHSERRQYFNETDATVNAKVKAALANNFIPIICVGEVLDERQSGKLDDVIRTQVTGALKDIAQADLSKVIFAYEPVWAIGTGEVCEAQEANRVIGMIRQLIGNDTVRILYGGSMKPDNVGGLMAQPEIDGGLVGGASLQPESFYQLITATIPAAV